MEDKKERFKALAIKAFVNPDRILDKTAAMAEVLRILYQIKDDANLIDEMDSGPEE